MNFSLKCQHNLLWHTLGGDNEVEQLEMDRSWLATQLMQLSLFHLEHPGGSTESEARCCTVCSDHRNSTQANRTTTTTTAAAAAE